MKNIIFLNFDIFNKEKTRFFNNVNKEINKKNYQLITLSSQKILNSKFQCQIMDFENYYIKDNLKLIKSKINISKVTQENWLKVLRLYYQNKSDVFIMNKINYIIYYYLVLFKKYNPVRAIVWTEFHPFCEIFIHICKFYKIEYLVAERGLLNETLVLEKNGIYGKSDLTKKNLIKKNNINEYNQYIKNYHKLKKKWPPSKKINMFNINENKRSIFFAGTNEIWHGLYPYKNKKTSPIFKSHLSALKAISKASSKFKEFEIIYKPHPKDKIFHNYKNKIPKNIRIVENEDAITLIKKTDLFITIASSLICDALIYKKPTIILGNFEISNKKISNEVIKKTDLIKFFKLFRLNKLKSNHNNWKQFANYMLIDYLYNISKYKFGKLNFNFFSNKLLNLINKKKLSKNQLNSIISTNMSLEKVVQKIFLKKRVKIKLQEWGFN